MSNIYFFRNYQGFCGGVLKVWDYFCHVKSINKLIPKLYLLPSSKIDRYFPWINEKSLYFSQSFNPSKNDLMFLSGLDWQAVPQNPVCPIINLIQHIRHANPNDPRYQYLSRKAIRICVSQEVTDAIKATGIVNGPVFTIPNGIDYKNFPKPTLKKDIPVLIIALKNSQMAQELLVKFNESGITTFCQNDFLSRVDFLKLIGRAQITVFLPNYYEGEGFYLPALEGMAMDTVVVCPDCVGNRSYCKDKINCLMPKYDINEIYKSTILATKMHSEAIKKMKNEARLKVIEHSLENERLAFAHIINSIFNY